MTVSNLAEECWVNLFPFSGLRNQPPFMALLSWEPEFQIPKQLICT